MIDTEDMAVPPATLSPLDLHQVVMANAKPSILDIFDNLSWFRGADWTPWRAFLAAAFALPMTDREYDIFRRCTGRKDPPKHRVSECWVPAGRRARKSAIGAFVGTYLGCYEDYTPYLAAGERARGLVMAKDKDEAHQIQSFAKAILTSCIPWMLEEEPLVETILLRNHTELRIRAASITGGRSRAMFYAALDEVAFFPKTESANPDKDIVAGIEYGMANIPGAMLIGLSSPYSKKGLLWEKTDQFWGVDGVDDVLVWKAPTLLMHDTPQIRSFVLKKHERDHVAARAEVGDVDGSDIYFREDIEDYVSPELIDALTVRGRTQVPPADRSLPAWGSKPKHVPSYWAFVDTSGGASDSFCLGISHWDKDDLVVVLDYLGEWKPPFDTDEVVREISVVLKLYGVEQVTGDAYAGQWPRDRFATHGIGYEVSPKTKDNIYRDSLPILTARRVQLLDNPTLKQQYVDLERRKSPKGIITIVHPEGGHDDLANACAGTILRSFEFGQYRDEEEIPASKPQDTHAQVEEMAQEAIDEMVGGRDGEQAMIDTWHGRWNY